MNRVNRFSILMHFVMNVGGGRYSRIAHQADYLSAFYLLSAFYQYFAHVSVQRLIAVRSEEHTSELQSLMRISYAVFCLKKKIKKNNKHYSILTKLTKIYSEMMK